MKKLNNKNFNKDSFFVRFLNRFLITGLITVICLIVFKKNVYLKNSFYDNVLDVNFNFSYFNNLYQKYFGSVLPFGEFFSDTEPVFSESLVYSDISSFLDGASLSVGSDYLVPSLDNGLVVFVGDKGEYGNTVIIKNGDGIDVWYSNLKYIDVSMYEYVSSGSLIGSCDDNLYLVFKKDGNVLDYKKYI